MKFLCDVHIPIRLSKHLTQLGFPSQHVNHILDSWNTKDRDISTYVDANDMILITKDQDFRNSFLLRRTPRKLVRVCLGNLSNDTLVAVFDQHMGQLKELHEQHDTFMVEMSGEDLLMLTK